MVGDDQTARLVDCPGEHSGHVSSPHHLFGDDERVGNDRQAAQD